MKRLLKVSGCWVFSCAALLLFAVPSGAIDLNESGTAQLTGSVETRLSIATQDRDPGTYPQVPAGNMVQNRWLGLIELNHDLQKVGGFDVKYHLVGRFMYEGVYDYGPQKFQDVPNENWVEDIDDFKWDADLWEAYIDVSRGPGFLRVGRQNLAWGETDLVRILDNITPLDNTFGGIFEDLDDRRIPLWMIRGTWNLGNVGPVTSLGLEGFLVPGNVDATVSPFFPPGTAYAPPNPPGPPPPFPFRKNEPETDWDNSRYGARFLGYTGGVNWSLGYQHTFLDNPRTRFVSDPTNFTHVALEFYWQMVDILGGSFNYHIEGIDTIIRGEAGYFWGVNQSVPAVNTPVVPTGLPAPFPPVAPVPGAFVESDELRYSLSFDKSVWIRWLNSNNPWDFTLQFAATTILDHDDRMINAYGLPIKETEWNVTFIAMNMGGWFNGSLLPEFVVNWDPRNIWFIQPALTYKWGDHVRTKLIYSTIIGDELANAGTFNDRDQITLLLQYLF